jgi:NAD+ kinase
MKLLLMPNMEKPHLHNCVRRLTGLQFSRPVTFLMESALAEQFPDCPKLVSGSLERLIDDCDICVVIGGDGTIIHEGKFAAAHHKPVLGINLGHLGFLATLELDQLKLMDALLTGDYTTEQRMLLRVTLQTPTGSSSWDAMNEAVISKGGPSNHMVELSVRNRGRIVGSYRADGLIVSTPTGSTAYAMSAGGPIIDPAINCIALTPLSSHSLFARPIIFDENSSLCISPCGGNTASTIYLTIDGEESIAVGAEDRLLLEKSDRTVSLINLTGKSFYDVLNEKLIWRATK